MRVQGVTRIGSSGALHTAQPALMASVTAGILLGLAVGSPVMAQATAERPHIVTTGPWTLAERSGPPERLYPFAAPPDVPLPAPTGWVAFATSDGRTMDFARPWRWPANADARPGATEIGFGWRQANWAAIVGYVKPDYARRAGYPAGAGPRSLVGFSFTVRGP